jgi:hypothetical protein
MNISTGHAVKLPLATMNGPLNPAGTIFQKVFNRRKRKRRADRFVMAKDVAHILSGPFFF